MMKKVWKNRSAVSPVIATILMVAITVVLAAVLYVMVMGFNQGGSQSPTMSTNKMTTDVAHQEKILVASISEAQIYANMKVSITVNTTSFAAQVASGTIAGTWPTGVSTVAFVDVASDGKVGAGDYFLITCASADTPVTLNVLYGSESKSISTDSWVSN